MNKFYETEDQFLAATIIATTAALPVNVQRTSPGRVLCVFNDDEQMQIIERLYGKGEMRVDPLMYSASLRYLDSQLKDTSENGGSVFE